MKLEVRLELRVNPAVKVLIDGKLGLIKVSRLKQVGGKNVSVKIRTVCLKLTYIITLKKPLQFMSTGLYSLGTCHCKPSARRTGLDAQPVAAWQRPAEAENEYG